MRDGSDAVADWPILNALLERGRAARPGCRSTTAAASAWATRSTPGMVVVADGTAGGRRPGCSACSPPTPARASCATRTPATSARSRSRASAASQIPMLDRALPMSHERGSRGARRLAERLPDRVAADSRRRSSSPARPARARRRCCYATADALRAQGWAPSTSTSWAPRRRRSASCGPPLGPLPAARDALPRTRPRDRDHAAGRQAACARQPACARCSTCGPRSTRPAAGRWRCCSTRPPRSARSRTSRACATWTSRSPPRWPRGRRGTLLATSFPTRRAGCGRRFERSPSTPLTGASWRRRSGARASTRGRSPGPASAGPRYLRRAPRRRSRRRRPGARPGRTRWRRAAGSSAPAGTPTRRCCCAAAATACRRRCWERWPRRRA